MDIDKYDKLDQQRWIEASMKLRYLDIKEKLDDDVYQRMYDEVVRSESNLTEEQRVNLRLVEQFENNHIRQSEYDSKVEELTQILNEIDNKYGINQQQEMKEFEEEVKRKRRALRAYQVYNRSIGQEGIMRDINVDNLSNNEVMDMYNSNSVAVGFEEHVRLGSELIEKEEFSRKEAELNSVKEEKRKKIEELRNKRSGNFGEPSVLVDIEKELNNFRNTKTAIEEQINEINRKLAFGSVEGLDVVDAIKGLGKEISKLKAAGEELKQKIDDFRLETESAEFSMSPSEIHNTVKKFTDKFKRLKVRHQKKYNVRVDYTNSKIDELKAMADLSAEVKAMVDGLVKLEKSEGKITEWQNNSYLANIDYDKLIEVNKQIIEIQNKLGTKAVVTDVVEGLGDELAKGIEDELKRVESEIGVTDNATLNQRLDAINSAISDFEDKLLSNNGSLSDNEKDAYNNRIVVAKDKLKELRDKLSNIVVYDNDYKEIDDKISLLFNDVNDLEDRVSYSEGHVDDVLKEKYVKDEEELRGRLKMLNDEIDSKEKNMERSQYESLKNKLNGIENQLEAILMKVKDPKMIKDADIFAILNKDIKTLGINIEDLNNTVKNAEKPIKRADVKKLNERVVSLEKEINRLEKLLEHYKNENINKYNSTLDELNKLKNKLEEVKEEYRKKCPLHVRAVKSAKNFYKKHKKTCLIVAGLSAIALIHATLGPVIIPAIMHGNIMIAGTSPALRPFFKFVNSFLGGMIHATKDAKGLWWLANGVMINPSCAVSSLLKGLAITGISSTPIIAPLIIAIKKLLGKMKTVELRQKFSETVSNGREKIDGMAKGTKDKINSKLKKKRNIEELVKKFKESDKSVDEFVKENKLNAKEELELYRALAIGVKKENEVQDESVEKVRR